MASRFSSRDFSIGRMKGRPVIDSNGDNVGTIEDVVVEPGTWKVSGFVVNVKKDVAEILHLTGTARRGFLDPGTARLEIQATHVKTVGDNVILNIDRAGISEALNNATVPPDGPHLGEREPFTTDHPMGDPLAGPSSSAYEPPRY